MDFTALVIQHNRETRDALQLMYDSIGSKGQRKKLLSNDTVRDMLARYGVKTETEG